MITRRPRSSVAVTMLCCALVGCNVEHTPPAASGVVTTSQQCRHRVFDHATAARLEDALKRASLAYDVAQPTDGGDGVIFEARDSTCDALNAISLTIVGPDLPNGRHIHFASEQQAQFKDWLRAQGIPFEIQLRDGQEYVVWNSEDSSRVYAWRFFPRDHSNFQAAGVSGQQSR